MPGKQVLLIVEDDRKVSALYAKFLSEELFDITFANQGRRALDAYDILRPDIVILDINLPDMSGLDVLRTIRTERGDTSTCVIIASVSSRDEVCGPCDELGIQGYLTKPFDLNSLNEAIIEAHAGDASSEAGPETLGVLIVEDDPKIAALYHRFLDPEAFRVHLAGSGAEALQYMADHKPQIIILDLELPGMSGIDLLKELRDNHVDMATTIVIASSHSKEEIVKECLRYNVQGFLVKPFNVKQLTLRVLRFRNRHIEDLKEIGWDPELL